MALTLQQLQAIETKLIQAIGNPTLSVAYDHFRKESRPIADLQKSLDQVRTEMAALSQPATPWPKRSLPQVSSGL